MEGMRNYVQHRNLPIRSISHSLGLAEENSICCAVTVFLDLDEIKEDEKVKEKIISELESVAAVDGRWVNVMPFEREYVQSLGRIHSKARALYADALHDADKEISVAVTKMKAVKQNENRGLFLVLLDDSKMKKEPEWISMEHVERRLSLEEKNKYQEHLARRFVSAIAIKQK